MGIVYVLAGTVCLAAAILTESRLDGILFGFAGALLDSLPIFLLEYTGESRGIWGAIGKQAYLGLWPIHGSLLFCCSGIWYRKLSSKCCPHIEE